MTSASEIQKFAKKAQKFASDNSPLILTVVGAAGIAGTAFLSGKGGFKAGQIIQNHESAQRIKREAGEQIIPLSFKQKTALTWKCYLPAAGVGAITLGAVVGSNRISTTRSAALASAFAISQEAADKYKAQVVKKLGDVKEKGVVEAVAKDRVVSNPPTETNTIIVSNSAGRQLFQDSWSGRYFEATMDDVKGAVNNLNYIVNNHGNATLAEFYDLLGLSATRESSEIGWNSDKLLDVYFAPVLHDDGKRAVMCIEYRVVPSRDYFRTH